MSKVRFNIYIYKNKYPCVHRCVNPLWYKQSLVLNQSLLELEENRGHVIRTRSHFAFVQTSPWLLASARRPQARRSPLAGTPLSEHHGHWLASVWHCCRKKVNCYCTAQTYTVSCMKYTDQSIIWHLTYYQWLYLHKCWVDKVIYLFKFFLIYSIFYSLQFLKFIILPVSYTF